MAYFKIGQLLKCIGAVLYGLRIWQKGSCTISKVILKDFFCKNFFHYGIRKTVEIFVEFNHQISNIFYMNSSIVTF